jgi:hypothetical protein
MADDLLQGIHVALHAAGHLSGLFRELFNGGELLLGGLDFPKHIVRRRGHFHDIVGHLLMYIVGMSGHAMSVRGAEQGFRGPGDSAGDVYNLVVLILHGQIQRTDLHDGFNVFVKYLGKFLTALRQTFVNPA